ncbi:MAG TPA: hypothetical protein PLP29_07665 [Candidatus Ozemobacteraceae bacterium]|nr:hypothetical protein [Candidatus Ozemobacteraceae bacterium]
MGDAFWDPIFTRLIDDREVLADIIRDTPEPVLIGLARKNPALWRACQPFVRGRALTRPDRFRDVIRDFADREAPLRRVLFFEWVNANPRTLAFPTLPLTPETPARLESGEFGPPSKISILARIDPRESAASLLKAYLERCRDLAAPPEETTAAEPPVDEVPRLRDEIRSLRRELKLAQEREKALHAHLSERGKRQAELEQALGERDARITALSAKLEQALADAARAGADPAPEPASDADQAVRSRLRDSLTGLETRNRELEAALARRTASGERLEQELEKNRRQRSDAEEMARRIEHLRDAQTTLERRLELLQNAVPARILAFAPPAAPPGTSVWIVEAPGIGRLVVDEALTRDLRPVEGEWILLHRDTTGAIRNVSPLEAAWKRELVGVLRRDESGWHLQVEETRELLPVGLTLQGFAPGDVVTAVVLPELAERKACAVPLKRQSAPALDTSAATEHRIGFAALQRKLGLIGFSSQEFARWLQQQHIPFLLEADAFRFEQPVQGLLPSLRPRLPAVPVCAREGCRSSLASHPFPREGRPDEVCGICHEEVAETAPVLPPEEWYDFEGRRILIVGGDAVGTAYRDVLGRHRLEVEWMSGFVGLGGAARGFGGVSAVVVILKQISHTLLRELTNALRGSGIPLLFAPKRGSSGVLRLLIERFKPSRIPAP